MITNELKAYLDKHKGIQEVWFASDGSYLFESKPTHLLRQTRDEVLNGKSAEETAVVFSGEKEESEPAKKKGKNINND